LLSSLAKIATPQFKHPLFLPLTSTIGLPNVDILASLFLSIEGLEAKLKNKKLPLRI
jgi:hypothetical protein